MERKVYCDYLRLFATFSVVIAHVAAVNWYSGDVNQWRWQVLNLYDSVVRWCVPVEYGARFVPLPALNVVPSKSL